MLCSGVVWTAHVLNQNLFTSAHVKKHFSLHIAHESNSRFQYLETFPGFPPCLWSGPDYEVTAEIQPVPLSVESFIFPLIDSRWRRIVNETLAWRTFVSEGAVRTITQCTSCSRALNGLNRSSLSVRSLFTFVRLTLAKEEQKQFIKEPTILVIYNVRFRLGSFKPQLITLQSILWNCVSWKNWSDHIRHWGQCKDYAMSHVTLQKVGIIKMFLKEVLLTAFIWSKIQ